MFFPLFPSRCEIDANALPSFDPNLPAASRLVFQVVRGGSCYKIKSPKTRLFEIQADRVSNKSLKDEQSKKIPTLPCSIFDSFSKTQRNSSAMERTVKKKKTTIFPPTKKWRFSSSLVRRVKMRIWRNCLSGNDRVENVSDAVNGWCFRLGRERTVYNYLVPDIY